MGELINDIIDSFNSLWKIKERGNSIEIVTPIATTNNMFVSVFLTKRDNEYVVTDGGWIDNETYECEISFEDESYSKLFEYYLNDYEIRRLEAKGKIFYYKKTSNPLLVPNLVYDLSNFINAIISASFIQFKSHKERENIGRFKKEANAFLKSFVEEKDIKTNYAIHDSLSGVRFNAVITKNSRFTLVSYVTGSNDSNYIISLGRSNLNFDLVEKQSVNCLVRHKITLIDDKVESFRSTNVAPFLGVINSKENRISLTWKDKDRLRELVE
ncbi:MAG: hypothetical protein WC679_13540 [Bacteroidales bacterium]|jgi:hypothetical protein